MGYLIIAEVDGSGHPIQMNHSDTKDGADDLVSELIALGHANTFAVESPHYSNPTHIVADVSSKTITFDQGVFDAEEIKEAAKLEIKRLETEITPSRLAEAFTDPTWMNAQNAKIKTEKDKL